MAGDEPVLHVTGASQACASRWGEDAGDWLRPVAWPFLMGLRGQTSRQLAAGAGPLVAAGLLERSPDAVRLTPAGRREAAAVVRKHRLWELYLTRRLELPSDHVHRDAESMEHALTETAVAELEELLGFPERDPHGRPIPPRTPVAEAAS